jgi:hypothetical protein
MLPRKKRPLVEAAFFVFGMTAGQEGRCLPTEPFFDAAGTEKSQGKEQDKGSLPANYPAPVPDTLSGNEPLGAGVGGVSWPIPDSRLPFNFPLAPPFEAAPSISPPEEPEPAPALAPEPASPPVLPAYAVDAKARGKEHRAIAINFFIAFSWSLDKLVNSNPCRKQFGESGCCANHSGSKTSATTPTAPAFCLI